MEAKVANQIPLEEILKAYKRYIFRSYAGYDMYLSPFRDESHPSFKVIHENNTWKDFGTGEYGSVVDLVMKKECCSFLEAMQIFDEKRFGIDTSKSVSGQAVRKEIEVNKVMICKITPLQNKTLLSYLKEQRGIDPDIAIRFCKEVYYRRESSGSDKNLFAVAFLNDSEGMEYRNGAGYKGAFINKDITTFNNNSERCAVFEGFMDFLTYQQIMKDKPDNLKIDFVILNSVAMVEKAMEFISRHSVVNCFLDNDPAGISAYNKISKSVTSPVNESKFKYPDHKDLNEFWTDLLKKKQLIDQTPEKKQVSQQTSIKMKL